MMDDSGHKKKLRATYAEASVAEFAKEAFVVMVQHCLASALFTSLKFAAL